MFRRTGSRAWALIAAALACSPSVAEDAYVRVGTGIIALQLPGNEFFAERGEALPFERRSNLEIDDGVLSGGRLELQAGIPLGPRFGLDDTAIEFRGALAHASASSRARFTDPGAGTRYGWTQLDNTAGFGTPDGDTLDTAIDRTAAVFEADVVLQGQAGSVVLFAGPAVRRLQQAVDISGEITTHVSLHETLDTVYGGMLVGAAVDLLATDDLLVNLRGSLAALGATTRYAATYLDDTAPEQTASLTDQQGALEAKLRLTVEKHISPRTVIGAYATGTFLSYVPHVNYGSVATDPANGVLRLEEAPMWSAGFGLTLHHAFD